MGYKGAKSDIEAVRIALSDEKITKVSYGDKLVFVKTQLPDGRYAWTLPTEEDIAKYKK